MVDYKTTIAGLLSALLPFIGSAFPKFKPIADGAAALALALLGYFAADVKK